MYLFRSASSRISRFAFPNWFMRRGSSFLFSCISCDSLPPDNLLGYRKRALWPIVDGFHSLSDAWSGVVFPGLSFQFLLRCALGFFARNRIWNSGEICVRPTQEIALIGIFVGCCLGVRWVLWPHFRFEAP